MTRDAILPLRPPDNGWRAHGSAFGVVACGLMALFFLTCDEGYSWLINSRKELNDESRCVNETNSAEDLEFSLCTDLIEKESYGNITHRNDGTTQMTESENKPNEAGKVIPGSECNAGWGRYSNGVLLNGTQINNSPANWSVNLRLENWHQKYKGLFIHPPSKFAMCTIQKNACSQWRTVLRNLFLNTTSGFRTPDYYMPEKSLKKYGAQGVESVFSDPSATRVVMIRDPLARFASVYIDKCFGQNCGNGFCFPRGTASKGKPISFRGAVNWILNADLSRINGHWSAQSEHCNLKHQINEYTVVGLMTKETLSSDAACIMEQAGLARFNTRGNPGSPFWLQRSQMMEWYKGADLRKKEEEVLKKLFTKTAALNLMAKFSQDYELFRLPIPTWIDDATGEWFDSLDHHKCIDARKS